MALQRLHLRKSSKLQRKSEFERLKSAPFRRAGLFMAVSVAPGEGKFARFGVICSRKFSLLAVERNRARRLLWESFRLLGDYEFMYRAVNVKNIAPLYVPHPVAFYLEDGLSDRYVYRCLKDELTVKLRYGQNPLKARLIFLL